MVLATKTHGKNTTTYGPSRATKAAADQDLVRARQSDTRKDMLEFARALRGAPAAASAGRLGNKDDQEKGRFDKVITVEAFEDLTKDKVSKGKKRKAEALEDVSQEKKNARAYEAAETAMMAAAERDCLFLHKRSAIQVMIDMWRPGDDCFWC